MTPYREPAEMPEEIEEMSPKAWPIWLSSLLTGLAAIVAGGAAVDGCERTRWHGLFGGGAIACLVVAVVAIGRAGWLGDKASK